MSEHGEPRTRRQKPWAVIGIGGATALVAVLLVGTLDAGAAAVRRAGLQQLVERPGCDDVEVDGVELDGAEVDGARVEPVVAQGGAQPIIEVSVPATALLRVDHGGHITAAATNTGCAPRPDDDLFYVRPDGSIVAAPTSKLAHRRWFGDFTRPGIYAAQRA